MLPASLAASRQRQGSDIRERGSRGEGGLRVRNINTFDMDVDVSIKAGRRKGGGRRERDLDQSLESISLFRQSHMGRLGLFGDEQSFLSSEHNEDFAAAAAAAQQQLLQEQLQQPDTGLPQNQPAPRPPAKFPFASTSAYDTASSADTDSLAELLEKQTAASARITKGNAVGLLAPSHAAHRGDAGPTASGVRERDVGAGERDGGGGGVLLGPGKPQRPPPPVPAAAVVDAAEVSAGDVDSGATRGRLEVEVCRQPKGLMVEVRALQNCGRLSAQEADEIFELVDKDHPTFLALHRQLCEAPLAETVGGGTS